MRIFVLPCAVLVLSLALLSACHKHNNTTSMSRSARILFLHHSTGKVILRGKTSRIMFKLGFKGTLDKLFIRYNRENNTNYQFDSQYFPKTEPYGWKNYPYDYYNIWVRNAGGSPYQDEPTLEILSKKYNVIIFKHCFPVSQVVESAGLPSADSEEKTIENYKLQYAALKEKMKQFPDTKFIVWTGAALVKSKTNEKDASRAKEFFEWVTHEWDEKGDNIFIWDFRSLETEGGLYLPEKFSAGNSDSHPGENFAAYAAPLFFQRMVDVIEDRGDTGNIRGLKD
jgi:hypothetical protein